MPILQEPWIPWKFAVRYVDQNRWTGCVMQDSSSTEVVTEVMNMNNISQANNTQSEKATGSQKQEKKEKNFNVKSYES